MDQQNPFPFSCSKLLKTWNGLGKLMPLQQSFNQEYQMPQGSQIYDGQYHSTHLKKPTQQKPLNLRAYLMNLSRITAPKQQAEETNPPIKAIKLRAYLMNLSRMTATKTTTKITSSGFNNQCGDCILWNRNHSSQSTTSTCREWKMNHLGHLWKTQQVILKYEAA